MSVYVNTYGRKHVAMSDGEIAAKIKGLFDLKPKAIERQLKLRQPMYLETAAYGHMGRKNEVVKKSLRAATTRRRPSTWNCSPGRNWTWWRN